MSTNDTQKIDLKTLARHRLHVICSTVCISIASVAWVSLILSDLDVFESDYFLPAVSVLGMLAIWHIVACVLLMVVMQTRKPILVVAGFLAYLLGWLVGVVLIVRASILLIKLRGIET